MRRSAAELAHRINAREQAICVCAAAERQLVRLAHAMLSIKCENRAQRTGFCSSPSLTLLYAHSFSGAMEGAEVVWLSRCEEQLSKAAASRGDEAESLCPALWLDMCWELASLSRLEQSLPAALSRSGSSGPEVQRSAALRLWSVDDAGSETFSWTQALLRR